MQKSVLVLILLLLVGCSVRNAYTNNTVRDIPEGVPEWYQNTHRGDRIVYGVGSGRSQSQHLAREKAIHNATAEISRASGELIINTFDVFVQESYAADSTQFYRFKESVSSQVAANLKGIRIERCSFDNEGTCYVLASCPLSGIQAIAIEVVTNQEDLFDELNTDGSIQDLIRVIQTMK